MTALRDIVLATKGVRRVRTPAGVRYFGLPIGSIITRDVRERAKARRRKKTRVNHPKKRPQRRDGQSGRGKGPAHDGSLGKIARDSDTASPKRPTIKVEKVEKQQWVGSERRDYFGYQFVSSDGKKGRIHWSTRNSTGARSNAKAEGEQYLRDWDRDNPVDKPAPTLAEVAKPTPKPRASRAKTPAKIEPSKDTKDYIDEMRGYHDRGFAGWDEAMGQEREVGKMADKYADRYDKNAARIEELYLLEEENNIAHEEGDRSEPGLGQWQQQELDMLLRNNEGLLKDVNTLNDLADLDRDLTIDDIPDDFGDSISMFLTVKSRAGRERALWKKDVVDYLNTKRVATQNKDSNGRTVPPQALMDARDDYVDLGKQLMKEINAHMDNDPGVISARKKYDDIDNGDPRPELDMTGFEKMNFEQRRALSYKYTKELDAWYQRRGFTDSGYSTVRDFDNDRAAKLRQADRDLAIAERKVKLEYLNSIRPMGAHPEAMPRFVNGELSPALGRNVRSPRGAKEEAEWDAMAEEALSIYPSSWVAALPDKYFMRAWSSRAFYNGPPTGTDGETLPDIHSNTGTHAVAFRPLNQAGIPDDYRNSSFSDYSVESAAHEFGHAMETFIPGITALEWAENYHRSGRQRKGGDWERIKTQAGMVSGETGFEDNWKQNYPGRAYATESDWNGDIHKEHWEVFTTGVQDTFGRSSRSKKYTHQGDDDVEQIILALMVTSNYYTDEEDFRR